MNKKIKLGILVISGIIIFFIVSNKVRENNYIDNNKQEIQEYTPGEEVTEEQERETIISIYYKSKDTGELIPEDRRIDSKELLENPYKRIVELLMEQPKSEELESVIPNNVKLVDAQVKGTTVEIVFSKELSNVVLKNEEEKNIINDALLKTLQQLNEVNDIKVIIDENN